MAAELKSLPEIQREVLKRAAIIGAADPKELPTYGHSEGTGRPHIEVDARGYHFVVSERGNEWERVTTRDPEDLLYHVFQRVTFNRAQSWELKHRNPSEDPRRAAFRHQEDLLSQLSAVWAARRAEEHRLILLEHPFDDDAFRKPKSPVG